MAERRDGPGTAAALAPAPTPPAMTELRLAARAAWPDGLVDLSRSEPLPVPLPDALRREAEAGFERARLYSPAGGLEPVRAAVGRYASARTGLDLGPDRVAITAGAMQGISVALRALVEPGGEVLVPVPYFHSHPGQVRMLGSEPRFVDTRPAHGELTPEAVERELSPRTRALLLCNPSNPAGVLLDRDALAAILATLPPDVAVIADEVYSEYLYAPQPPAPTDPSRTSSRDAAQTAASTEGGTGSANRSCASSRIEAESAASPGRGRFVSVLEAVAEEDAGREAVVLATASKTAAMPGWRVGSAIGTEGLAPRLAHSAATLSGAPSTASQLTYAAWLDDPPAFDRMAPYRPRLRDALDALAAAGLSVRPPDGTYYVWATAPAGPDDAAPATPSSPAAAAAETAPSHRHPTAAAHTAIGSPAAVLATANDAGVLVWPGSLFGDPESVRISLSVPRAELRDGVERFVGSKEGGPQEGDVSVSRSRR